MTGMEEQRVMSFGTDRRKRYGYNVIFVAVALQSGGGGVGDGRTVDRRKVVTRRAVVHV